MLWRLGNGAIAWIGSANLTNRGLQEPGELMAELRDGWGRRGPSRLRNAFEEEWSVGSQLDEKFLRTYRQAPRVGGHLNASRRRGGAHVRQARKLALVVTVVSRHYPDDSATVRRVEARLGGTADAWFRSAARALQRVRRGHLCLVVDTKDRFVTLGLVTDVARDGRFRVLAYEPFSASGSERRLTARLRASLVEAGLRRTKAAVATQWVGPTTAAALVQATYGVRLGRRVERALKGRGVGSGQA
jgi:hypothetical protein